MSNASVFVDRYLAAWRSNDPADIAAAFAPDAVYSARPYDPTPARGIEAIIAHWLEEQDAPGVWSFEWSIELETDDAAVIRGVTRYSTGAKQGTYDNLWLVRFDAAGRATEFTDWWVPRRAPSTATSASP